ncbi:glycoside hydrolase family 16 protein [Streptomyces physcomitrii]|uniref:Glycoside hydrolase family 16 protein n=1 Tax=Streptomyces physcomitrii TaxID=2724184 RepID=A0ABX1GUX3_9ACTN|nr:glycoside hydrolase family 16 protein [Streptomyces physcomitrii]NKI39868.1 glycoside hydrolase family 16 protein [Streptomyces physcomitrii]
MRPSRLRLAALGASAACLLTLTATLSGPASATGTGGPAAAPAAPDSAAERYDWGTPVAAGTDEFDYGSEDAPARPDDAKWSLPGADGECWDGHAGNGRRCSDNSRVVGGLLRQSGAENGDSGWMGSKFGQRYGRWEARVRSEATGEDNGRQYHPLLILWPDSDRWPEDGEYDYLENTAPGEDCSEAFIHYPHNPDAAVQQEHAEKCGVDLTQWHNIAVEWTPDHVKGFVDGEEWFSFSGGANDVRDCIQCAPSMHQTIQLDNFFGDSMQSAVYEVDWTRAYSIDGVSEPAEKR